MDITNITAQVYTCVKISLTFDDSSISNYDLKNDDITTISYLCDGKIVTSTGKIISIGVVSKPSFGIDNYVQLSNSTIFEIRLDCSEALNSNVKVIYSSNIRGINDTAFKYKEGEPESSYNHSSDDTSGEIIVTTK